MRLHPARQSRAAQRVGERGPGFGQRPSGGAEADRALLRDRNRQEIHAAAKERIRQRAPSKSNWIPSPVAMKTRL